MGHSDILVMMNAYTYIGFDGAEKKQRWMEEFRKAQTEIKKKNALAFGCGIIFMFLCRADQ